MHVRATRRANAQTAGASAVLIFNEGQPGRTDAIAGTLGTPDFTIPVLGTTFAFGEEIHDLLASGPVTMHVTTSTISETRETYNVLADTQGGDPNHVVVQGSHLDSVVAGPGINDNGSGSAYNLESAIQFAKQHIKPRNKVRFAWWGAEELNLIGSTFYVNSLSDAEFSKIALNLNHDMLASPNFVRFVYDGDGSDTPARRSRRLGADRAGVPELLRQPGAGDRADGVRRALGLRSVHRPRRAGRRPVLRRRGDQDARAGGDLRRRRRCGVRPLLPPGVRRRSAT